MNHHDDFQSVRIGKQWKKQEGITGIGIAVILGMIAFFVLIALRLFPIYMEHFSVASHLGNLASDAAMKKKTNKEILSKLNKSFQIDDVKNVNNDHIFIERYEDGGVTVTIEYEVRTPAIGNVDMVVRFSDEVKIN